MLLGWLGILRATRAELDNALAGLDTQALESAKLEGGMLEYQAALQEIAEEVGRKSASIAKDLAGEPLCDAVREDVTAALKDLGDSRNLGQVLEVYHAGLEDVHNDLLAAAEGPDSSSGAVKGELGALVESAVDGDTKRLRSYIFDSLDSLKDLGSAAKDGEEGPENSERATCAAQYAQQVKGTLQNCLQDTLGAKADLEAEIEGLKKANEALKSQLAGSTDALDAHRQALQVRDPCVLPAAVFLFSLLQKVTHGRLMDSSAAILTRGFTMSLRPQLPCPRNQRPKSFCPMAS